MKLTIEQTQKFIEDNTLWIHKQVNRFLANTPFYSKAAIREDLVQEVTEVLLQHILRSESEEELKILPIRSALHAMHLFVIGNLALSVPRSTKNAKEIISSLPRCFSVDDYGDEARNIVDLNNPFGLVEETTAFNKFLTGLNDQDRKILLAMLKYGSYVSVAKHLKMSETSVRRHVVKNLAKYAALCGDEGYLGGKTA